MEDGKSMPGFRLNRLQAMQSLDPLDALSILDAGIISGGVGAADKPAHQTFQGGA